MKEGDVTMRKTVRGSRTPLWRPEQLPKAPDQSACENGPPWIKVEGPKGQCLTSHKKGQSTPSANLSFHYCRRLFFTSVVIWFRLSSEEEGWVNIVARQLNEYLPQRAWWNTVWLKPCVFSLFRETSVVWEHAQGLHSVRFLTPSIGLASIVSKEIRNTMRFCIRKYF